MTLKAITAGTALVGLVLGLSLAIPTPAEAAKKGKTTYIYYGTQDRMVTRTRRAPTRLTVRPRSFLSGGTETLQRDQHYTDYSHPPGYVPYIDRTDPKLSFTRMPLPDAWDIPGWPKF